MYYYRIWLIMVIHYHLRFHIWAYNYDRVWLFRSNIWSFMSIYDSIYNKLEYMDVYMIAYWIVCDCISSYTAVYVIVYEYVWSDMTIYGMRYEYIWSYMAMYGQIYDVIVHIRSCIFIFATIYIHICFIYGHICFLYDQICFIYDQIYFLYERLWTNMKFF